MDSGQWIIHATDWLGAGDMYQEDLSRVEHMSTISWHYPSFNIKPPLCSSAFLTKASLNNHMGQTFALSLFSTSSQFLEIVNVNVKLELYIQSSQQPKFDFESNILGSGPKPAQLMRYPGSVLHHK